MHDKSTDHTDRGVPVATEKLKEFNMPLTLVTSLINCLQGLKVLVVNTKHLPAEERRCMFPAGTAGVCYNVEESLAEYSLCDSDVCDWLKIDVPVMQILFETWPGFSGSPVYPILAGHADYWRGVGIGTAMFRWEGKQLEARLDLIDHMIKELCLLKKEITS